MTLSTFGFIFTGIMLNALAQLLLKAGTNRLAPSISTAATCCPPPSSWPPSCPYSAASPATLCR